MSRAEHVQQCKDRALEYAKNKDFDNAFMSMASDLQKHEKTANHLGIQLIMIEQMGGKVHTVDSVEKFINGFN